LISTLVLVYQDQLKDLDQEKTERKTKR
jgi:hypothetical protein